MQTAHTPLYLHAPLICLSPCPPRLPPHRSPIVTAGRLSFLTLGRTPGHISSERGGGGGGWIGEETSDFLAPRPQPPGSALADVLSPATIIIWAVELNSSSLSLMEATCVLVKSCAD